LEDFSRSLRSAAHWNKVVVQVEAAPVVVALVAAVVLFQAEQVPQGPAAAHPGTAPSGTVAPGSSSSPSPGRAGTSGAARSDSMNKEEGMSKTRKE
jgi:hypothetical protein